MSGDLAGFLRFWAGRMPGRDAIRADGQRLTWRELDEAADRVAAGLQQRGLGPGATAGILLDNRPEFVIALLGILRSGAAAGLLNPRLTSEEIGFQLRDSHAGLVFTSAASVAAVSGAGIEVVLVDSGAGLAALGGAPLRPVDIDPHSTALLSYTSGTTGRPKGALLTHAAITAAAYARILPDAICSQDVQLITTPLALAGPVSYLLREGIVSGSTTVLERAVDGDRLLEVVERERITNFGAVPVVFERMLASPRLADTDLSSLRCVQVGGAPVGLEVIRAWQALGVRMLLGYGQTETAGACVAILYPDEAERKIGTSGRPIMHHQIRIVGGDDEPVPTGEIGEIQVRGPAVMTSYHERPEETAATLVDGWLRTGDTGFLDDEGYLTVTGRARDVIISGGMNVYPAEIELYLVGRAGIHEGAVIGVPDPKWGEVPMLVVPSADAVDREEMRKLCETHLARYKHPRYILELGEPLPRNTHGKIQKNELADRARALADGAERLEWATTGRTAP